MDTMTVPVGSNYFDIDLGDYVKHEKGDHILKDSFLQLPCSEFRARCLNVSRYWYILKIILTKNFLKDLSSRTELSHKSINIMEFIRTCLRMNFIKT